MFLIGALTVAYIVDRNDRQFTVHGVVGHFLSMRKHLVTRSWGAIVAVHRGKKISVDTTGSQSSVGQTDGHEEAALALQANVHQIERAKQEWEVTLDGLSQLVALLDAQGLIIRTNRTIERWDLGRVNEVKGAGMHGLLHARCTDPACDLVAFWRQAWQDVTEGFSVTCEINDALLRRYVRIEVQPVVPRPPRGSSKEAGFAVAIVHDITQAKQAEQAIQASEKRYRDLVEYGPGLICSHDLEGRLLSVSSAVAEALGYPPGTGVERNLREFLAPSVQHEFDTYLERIRRYAADSGFMRLVTKDGTECVWSYRNVLVEEPGKPPYVIGHAQDVTERMWAERALRESEATLQKTYTQMEQQHREVLSIVQQLRLGVITVDEHEAVVFLNRSCQRFLGKTQAEVVGHLWTRVLPFATKDKAKLKFMCTQPLEARHKVPVYVDMPGGRHYWMDIEVQNDPYDPRRRIFFLYDMSEIHDLRRLLDDKARFQDLVGKSEPMMRVYRLIREMAKVDTTVLIEGETGTGKELVARAIHDTSRRRHQPFIAVNCAGLSESVLGSQLFGHKRGAFTGAIADHQGLFEAAHKGTLFLDEIGDLALNVQISLLRALQEREITRLGESTPRKIDVHILTATQHNLADLVHQGSFRADLLYRIRVVRISLPRLRERREDIPLLVSTFLTEHRVALDKPVQEVSHEAMQLLLKHAWPGNVRELKSTIEFAVIHCQGSVIQAEDLPPELGYGVSLGASSEAFPIDEKERLLAAIEQAGGNRRRAAGLLGISRATLYRRLTALGIRPAG